jgi:hypothetical protein
VNARALAPRRPARGGAARPLHFRAPFALSSRLLPGESAMRRSWWVVAALLWSGGAQALEWQLGTGVQLRHAGEVDLAAMAGADGYGSARDTSPGQLGWQISGGLQPIPAFEVGLDASIAVGGLAIGDVEERYFDQQDNVGSSATVEAGLALRWLPVLSPDLRLFTGGAASLQRMSSASGIGHARLDSLAIGPEAGLRWRVSEGDGVDGELQLRVDGRWHQPLRVEVAHSADNVLFETTDAEEGFWSAAVSVSWIFAFR